MLPFAVFEKNHRCIAAESLFGFAPGVTLVVGDQGSGKSSLLQQLSLWATKTGSKGGADKFDDRVMGHGKDCVLASTWTGKPGRFGFFDMEKNNPRTAPGFGMYGIDTGVQVASMWGSHGEFVRGFLRSIDGLGTGVLVLDEPDMALSPRSVFNLIDAMKKAAEKGGQIIASVHNTTLIGAFDEVLSMEHQRWMSPDEFLELEAFTPVPEWDPKKPREFKVLHSTTAPALAAWLKEKNDLREMIAKITEERKKKEPAK